MESLEMTRLQCAYQLSKEIQAELCGISCHVYLEFDTRDLDYKRLNEAWHALYNRHGILHGRSGELGYIDFIGETGFEPIKVIETVELDKDILQVRQELCEAEPKTEENVAKLFVMKDSMRIRKLCFSMSLMFADPLSFQILLEDFSDYYLRGSFLQPMPEQALQKYYDITWKCSREEKRIDKEYWKKRVEKYGRGYRIPAAVNRRYIGSYESYDLLLAEEEYSALVECVRDRNVSLEEFLLGVYGWVLQENMEDSKVVINYPVFHREAEYQRIVGDFSKNLLVGLDFSSVQTFEELMHMVTSQVREDMKHMNVDGLEVQGMYNRMLKDDNYKETVVFSPSLHMPLVSSQFTEYIGELVCLSSKTPMVALDAQFYQLQGRLFLTWVVPQNWFESGKIERMLEDYVRLCRKFSDSVKWKERLEGK